MVAKKCTGTKEKVLHILEERVLFVTRKQWPAKCLKVVYPTSARHMPKADKIIHYCISNIRVAYMSLY